MVVRDMFNNFLKEDDTVTVALSPGNFLLGKIKKISSGLDGNPPAAIVSVDLPLPIHPGSGILQGAIYVQLEDKKIL